ncbi:homoserine dehydrogenase [Gammaproteobacteria bacterium]|nr:homoserine dehydrogenase [Gammaproteobacteria bacterium]
MKPVKIGLLGFGTVGNGIASVLNRSGDEIARRAGRKLEIVGACVRNLDRNNPYNIALTTDANLLLDNPEIEIIVEIMGGHNPAKKYITQALNNGKHVVTANKALIAVHGNDIFKLAQEQDLMVAFEAAVAGGIPIIKIIREGLASNQIEWLAGIINGTGNFILTEMKEKGRDFAEVLAQAQALGYAEADPAFDVEGIDAAHKLTILASIAFGIPLQFDKVYIEGITKITREDVQYADEFGYNIKHLGLAKRKQSGIELRVHPTLIPKKRLIANVNGIMNAILVKGDAVGPVLSYGAGAGSEPTASAVIADLVDVVRTLNADSSNRVPHLAFQADRLSNFPILSQDEIKTAYYLRMQALDKPGVLAEITRILSQNNISIEQMMQKKSNSGESAQIIMTTHRVKEQLMQTAITEIESLNVLNQKIALIRIESLWGS